MIADWNLIILMKCAYLATYITGDVGMSPGSEDWNSIPFDLKLFRFRFLPIILITVLKEEDSGIKSSSLYIPMMGTSHAA